MATTTVQQKPVSHLSNPLLTSRGSSITTKLSTGVSFSLKQNTFDTQKPSLNSNPLLNSTAHTLSKPPSYDGGQKSSVLLGSRSKPDDTLKKYTHLSEKLDLKRQVSSTPKMTLAGEGRQILSGTLSVKKPTSKALTQSVLVSSKSKVLTQSGLVSNKPKPLTQSGLVSGKPKALTQSGLITSKPEGPPLSSALQTRKTFNLSSTGTSHSTALSSSTASSLTSKYQKLQSSVYSSSSTISTTSPSIKLTKTAPTLSSTHVPLSTGSNKVSSFDSKTFQKQSILQTPSQHITTMTSQGMKQKPLSQNISLQPSIAVSSKSTKVTTMKTSEPSYKHGLVVPTTSAGMPEYEFGSTAPQAVPEVQFTAPELDNSIQTHVTDPMDATKLKVTMINSVATSLLRSPDFRDKKDETMKYLTKLGKRISHHDPEFILKLALYTRNELNVRTTANFLLALASSIPYCRPYLKKYFSASVRLPSDWIEIAEIYQAFHDKSINFGSLPTALRKVMGNKFPNFDAYQLAKYNKDTSKKKKKGKKKDNKKGPGKEIRIFDKKPRIPKPPPPPPSSSSNSSSDSEDSIVCSESESEEELERLTFTLKQLIRKLHIFDPVEHVMCLVGKRYPEDPEAFRRSGLPGIWDQDKAGKRMKLPTPETWETQVSLRGNKASIWEELIDHRKLPFMAMLRNLRNLIIAAISQKHHQWVINKLTDERAVVNSRQFPFRFFSAYEVLKGLENVSKVRPLSDVQKGFNPMRKIRKVKEIPEISPDLLKKYENALDSALKIATHHNVKPISGTTVVLCNVGISMQKPCTSARGLGKPKTVLEIGLLLGLMCKYACEDCTMNLYGGNVYREVSLEEGTILNNMDRLLSIINGEFLSSQEGAIPPELLRHLLINRVAVDNLVLLTDQMNLESRDGKGMLNFLNKYRQLVNPNLLFVSIDLCSRTIGVSSTITPQHENNIHLAGYSDQILRFIAERSDSAQLIYVENIDKSYNLREVKTTALVPTTDNQVSKHGSEKQLIPIKPQMEWRTVRVFISSTFRDTHGERDLLTRYVFPELRRRCHSLFINVFEIDLRWGITEADSRSHKALEICLSEIARCNYFIGLLGNRYGWVPQEYEVPDSAEYDWVKEYPKGRSITELEMYHAALCDPDKATGKAFFYFRDPAIMDDIPREYRKDFKSDSHEHEEKLESLKSRIRTSGLEAYDGYRCRWLGEVQDKPLVHSLEEFGQRVLHNLWNAIQKDYPVTNEVQNPLQQFSKLNQAFLESQASNFVGRTGLLTRACEKIDSMEGGVLIATGKPGSGKSAFMAALAKHIVESNKYPVVTHFIGAAPGSSDISNILMRICHEMKQKFSLDKSPPEDYLELVKEWPEFISNGLDAIGTESKIVVLIDGIDLLDDKHNGRSIDWLPEIVPPGAIVVMSALEGGMCHSVLRRHDCSPLEIVVGALDISDKAKIVRQKLAKHRKALDESPFNNQMKMILSKRDANIPLYLHLACEEVRMFGVFEEVSTFLRKMPATIATLLQEVLNRLEIEHGQELLSAALTMLCIVRNGLKEQEMAEILAMLFSTSSEGKVPPVVLSQLIRSLQTFLQPIGNENSDTMILAHKEVEKVVRARYLRGAQADKERKLHTIIGKYFMNSADPSCDQSFKGNDVRAFSELPFHLLSAGEWKLLEDTLCNLHYVVSKCQLGLANVLLEDFSPSLQNLSSSKGKELQRFSQSPKIQEFKNFVSRNLHVLLATPTLALQQAVNEPGVSLVSKAALNLVQESPYPMIYWMNKDDKADPCKMVLSHLGDSVTATAVSRDGALIATGFQSCVVRLYDIATGNEIHSYIGHSGPITSLCFVGEQALCSASRDSTLSLWNIKEGHRLAVMKGHSRSVTACISNSSGKSIVSVSLDMHIKVWDATGKFVSYLKSPGKNSPINCVSFHPEGQLIVVGSWDSRLTIWDTYNTKKLKVLKGHSTSIQACEYFQSGRHIVSASLDGEVRIWSTRSGVAVGVISGHSAPITSLCFTPNGQHLVTASNDKLVKMWSGTLGSPVHNLGISGQHGYGHCLVFDRSKQLVTVGYHDGFVLKFNIQTGMQTFTKKVHAAAVVAIAIFEDIHMTASSDRTLKIWTPSSLPFCMSLEGHRAPVISATWTNKGLASVSEDMAILLWPHDVKKYERSLRKPKSHSIIIQPTATLSGHTAQVSSISFSSDGMTMVTASHDKSLIVWDTLTKKAIKTIPNAHKDWINTCAFSNSTPEFLVTGSNDFNLKIWDTSEWKEKSTLKGHTSGVTSISCSEGCIISGSVDGSVKVWTKKGIEVTTLYCHTERVNAVIVDSPSSGKEQAWGDKDEDDTGFEKKLLKQMNEVLVITTSDDGNVGVWKPFVPNEITTLKGHSDRVLSVKCSPKNEIVSSSLDGTVRIWKPELHVPEPTGLSKLDVFEGHTGPVSGTALCMNEINGTKMMIGATCGRDGYFVIWRIQSDDVCDSDDKISDKLVTPMYRVKSSDKSLSSICLTMKTGVLVGHDTGEIEIWRFSDTEFPYCDTRLTSGILAGAAPISKLGLTKDSKFLLASSWSNQVIAIAGGNKKVYRRMDGHKDWVMDVCSSWDGKQSSIYSVGLDQQLIEWSIDVTKSKTQQTQQSTTIPGVKHKIPLEIKGKREDPWALTLTCIDNKYIAIGDSEGRVLVWDQASKLFVLIKKVHKDSITTLDSFDNKIVSGSKDGTLKIWELKKAMDIQLKQVGHFYCQSSISSLSINQLKKNAYMLLVGDCNGYVTVLKWK